MVKSSTKKQIAAWNIIAIIFYFLAVAFNIRAGGIYNLEIGIGALVLGLIKIWQEMLS